MNLERTLKSLSNSKRPWPIGKEYLAKSLREGKDIMFIDVDDARKNAREIVDAFQEIFGDHIRKEDIRFATKAAPCGEILHAMHEMGLGLEVASEAEVKMAQKLGVEGKNIVFSNPGKHTRTAKAALEAGVRLFVTDSEDDLNTLRAAASQQSINPKDIRIIMRLQQPEARKGVDSCGSHLGLPVKDETQPIDAIRLAQKAAKELGFKVVGTTFNAGTNLHDMSRWQVFIREAARFAKLAKEAGLSDVTILDMGGSFPAKTSKNVKPIKEFATVLRDYIEEAYGQQGIDFPQLIIEPGRSISHSAYLFSTVINKKPNLAKDEGNGTMRDDFHLVTTAGHYNSGLRVTLSDYDGDSPDKAGFGIHAFRLGANDTLQQIPGEKARYTMEGLVTADVAKYASHASLPRDLKQGDVVCFSEMGAYSRSFITHWLGFDMPEMVIYDSAKPDYKRHISSFNPTVEIEWAGARRIAEGSYGYNPSSIKKDVPALARVATKVIQAYLGYSPHTMVSQHSGNELPNVLPIFAANDVAKYISEAFRTEDWDKINEMVR